VEDSPDTIAIELEGGEVRTVAYSDIDKARTVFEWGPEPKPAKPKPKAGSTTGSAKQTKKSKKKKVDAT
jgi:hypothetical protein